MTFKTHKREADGVRSGMGLLHGPVGIYSEGAGQGSVGRKLLRENSRMKGDSG